MIQHNHYSVIYVFTDNYLHFFYFLFKMSVYIAQIIFLHYLQFLKQVEHCLSFTYICSKRLLKDNQRKKQIFINITSVYPLIPQNTNNYKNETYSIYLPINLNLFHFFLIQKHQQIRIYQKYINQRL